VNANVEVLISESRIQSRVAQLGAAITRDFEGLNLFIDYLGFAVLNVFVVGYGLDYQGQYRNLRQIGVVATTEGGQHD
jgi:Hypoxanthine-guanine phosphoribosyltransferase